MENCLLCTTQSLLVNTQFYVMYVVSFLFILQRNIFVSTFLCACVKTKKKVVLLCQTIQEQIGRSALLNEPVVKLQCRASEPCRVVLWGRYAMGGFQTMPKILRYLIKLKLLSSNVRFWYRSNIIQEYEASRIIYIWRINTSPCLTIHLWYCR